MHDARHWPSRRNPRNPASVRPGRPYLRRTSSSLPSLSAGAVTRSEVDDAGIDHVALAFSLQVGQELCHFQPAPSKYIAPLTTSRTLSGTSFGRWDQGFGHMAPGNWLAAVEL